MKNLIETDSSHWKMNADRLSMDSPIADGIVQGWIQVWFQPLVEPASEQIVAAEAMLRVLPEHGETLHAEVEERTEGKLGENPGANPSLFLEKALEETSEEEKLLLDVFVIQESCKLLKARMEAGRKVVPVHWKLSQAFLLDPDCGEVLQKKLTSDNLPVNLLALILDPSANNREKWQQLLETGEKLRRMGFSCLLDGFAGGGLPLSEQLGSCFKGLILDASLIHRLGDSIYNSLIWSLFQFARENGMHTLAAGVETQLQADYLKEMQCGYAQGIYFAKAQPREMLEILLDIT